MIYKYYYKDGEVWAFYEDGSQDELITNEFTLMTDEEVDRHLNPENHLSEEDKRKLYLASLPQLTRYQFLRCLLENGFKSSDIEAQILTIEDEMTRELALLGFKEATNFMRTDDSIIAMQSVLGFSDEQVDQLWEYAMKL